MKQCNRCAKSRCGIIKSAYPKMRTRHTVTVEQMRMNCHEHFPFKPFTAKFIEVAVTHGTKHLSKLLRISGISVANYT